ncbi:hypothetical protein MNBD_GAMMA01-1400 [hydrothermal vent metagenome]|uniref:Mobilization protein n=1 Tax=hydrothermal vent metagenome TaxID=652676 RepID=A0A3B0W082_9ZZZZ
MAKTIEQLQSEADAAQKKAAEAKKKLRTAKLVATKKEREQTRKNDTRRKITFGAFMLNKVKHKDPESEKLYKEFLASLTKKQDREIFNLEPLPEEGKH